MAQNTEIGALIRGLNHSSRDERISSLQRLMQLEKEGTLETPVTGTAVNNHIHTTYSFSPYSPTKALWQARQAGLQTAGIMDHDSVGGAEEFIAAGRAAKMATTIGAEVRVDMSTTALNGRLINNPDQKSIVYMAMHAIPHTQIATIASFLRPYVEHRNTRNRQMVQKINHLYGTYGIDLDFDEHVVPLSMYHDGGSITERHISLALAKQMIASYGRGKGLLRFLEDDLKIPVKNNLATLLLDGDNPFYEYDLLGLIKGEMVSSFYIDATNECPDVRQVITLCQDTGAISAYAYLGDVKNSVTGDKKDQEFEDSYLDLLFEVVADLGFSAVTYMPSRNTKEQLFRLKSLCQQWGLMEISGEDINSPRQQFVCQELELPEFHNLVDSTWALIGHEAVATRHLQKALFAEQTKREYPDLQERIAVYRQHGLTEYAKIKGD